MKPVEQISMVLTIVGGVNWGLIGLFQFDVVAALFGEMSALTRVIYSLIGLAAVYEIVYAASTISRSRQTHIGAHA